MPSINSTEDLLNLLESNEEFRIAVRRWVLTDDLLAMPDFMRRMDERLSSVESTQLHTAVLLDQVAARLDRLEARQDRTEAWQERTEARHEKSEAWQERTEELAEARHKRAEARHERSEARHKRAEERLDRLEIDVAVLKGLSLQSQLHHIGLNAVVSRFRIRGARLVRAVGSGASDTDFNDAVLDAMDGGLISDDDYTRLMATDMVVSGARAGANVYVAVGASFTISSDDIDKVKRSASLIKRVYPDIDAKAALYYFAADDERRAAATDAGVEIIRAEIRPA